MSTKTIKKRIALVAMSALTAGLISVVSAPVANAAQDTATQSNVLVAGATTNPILGKENTLYVASLPSITGSAVALATSTTEPDTVAGTAPSTSTARSLGLVNVSDIAGGLIAETTQTAVLLSTGSISVYTSAKQGEYSAITVTGGTITSSTGTSLNSTSTVATGGHGTNQTNWGAVVKPSSGSTTMTIRLYTGATAEATALASPTLGTLSGQNTVTIAAASTAGAISAANSGVFGSNANNTASLTADHASFRASKTYGQQIFFNVRVRDAYNTAVTAGSGVLSVSATNGALVEVAASSVGTPTLTSAFLATTTPDNDMVSVSAASTAAVTTTITVSYNGTVIGTRTVSFTGEVAKITLSSPVIGNLGTATGNNAYYRLEDSAGNTLYSAIEGTAQTNYATSALIGNAALETTSVGAVVKDTDPSVAATTFVVTTGKVRFTCGSSAGNGSIGLVFTNPSGTRVTSNNLNVSCAGAPLSYSASWDKASYVPGDVAKLTVTFRDSKGRLANDVSTITDTSSAASIPVISIGGLDKTVTGPTTGDTLDQGKITYTYTVGVTENSFSGSVKFPTVDTRQAAATGLPAQAVTTTIVVKPSTATVSNADVLKSIVALIASINKQIQALQKLILRR
jgi:hypothetical protein